MKPLKQILEEIRNLHEVDGRKKEVLPGVYQSHMDSKQIKLHLHDHWNECKQSGMDIVKGEDGSTTAISHQDDDPSDDSFPLEHYHDHLHMLSDHIPGNEYDGPDTHIQDHNSVTIRTTDGEHHNFRVNVDRPRDIKNGYGKMYFTHRKI